MVRNPSWGREGAAQLGDRWKTHKRYAKLASVFIGVLLIVHFAGRWYVTSYGPLSGRRPLRKEHADWANQALRDSNVFGGWFVNAMFSLVASTWQVIYILFGFTFFFFAASAAICISRLAGAPGVRIIPDLRSDDPRRGFEAFEALV